ncbi:MAG: ABC transporter permease [Chloroflexota bacterium]|nr:ABC transporter permease [Dehalococcoidia bacterium]MDW8254803.1 ABC transporter permease [Chloroflexota bacterium]
MAKLIVNRLIQLVFVIIVVSTLLFVLMRASGDPVSVLYGDIDNETRLKLRRELGFDDPLIVQYARFWRDLLIPKVDARGNWRWFDFGDSLRARRPAMQVVLDNLGNTVQLAVVSLALAVVVGIPLGIFSALTRGLPSVFFMLMALILQSTPSFFLGIILVLIFAVQLRILPPFGYGTPAHFILPAICLAGFPMARLARLMRSALLDVMSMDYIRTARAKGLSNSMVVIRHALRNAMIPIVTAIGLDIAFLLSGSVIIENLFAWPGIGRQLVTSTFTRDYNVVQAIVFIVAIWIVLAFLLVDIAYKWIDPRIKYD